MSKKPFAEVVREMKERRDRLVAFVRAEFEANGIFRAKSRHGGFVTISRSTRPGVQFQLTYWHDESTPTGHIDEPSLEEAAKDLAGHLELERTTS